MSNPSSPGKLRNTRPLVTLNRVFSTSIPRTRRTSLILVANASLVSVAIVRQPFPFNLKNREIKIELKRFAFVVVKNVMSDGVVENDHEEKDTLPSKVGSETLLGLYDPNATVSGTYEPSPNTIVVSNDTGVVPQDPTLERETTTAPSFAFQGDRAEYPPTRVNPVTGLFELPMPIDLDDLITKYIEKAKATDFLEEIIRKGIVEASESLDESPTHFRIKIEHGVDDSVRERAVKRINEKLKKYKITLTWAALTLSHQTFLVDITPKEPAPIDPRLTRFTAIINH